MKVLKFTVLLIVLLMLVACIPWFYDQSITFHNNSACEVYIDLGLISRDMGGTLYPDTSISKTKVGVPVPQRGSCHYSYSSDKKDEFKKNGTLSLFIFDADTFNLCSWEEIQKDYKILQRYDISYENIKALKYHITYPPTEAMKDVKMYPSYEQ